MICAFLRNSSLRRNPSFMLLCNLAISDLGIGLICQPLFIAVGVIEAKGNIELSCKIAIALKSTTGCLGTLSFITITAISFDRFLAIHLGLSYRSVVTVGKIKVAISLQWLAAMLLGMTCVLHISVFFLLIIIVVCLCLTFTTFNYLAIGRKLYGQSARVQPQNGDVEASKQRNPFNTGQYKRTLKNTLYVYGAFIMCYLPHLGVAVTLKFIGDTNTVHAMHHITATFVLCNSAINPCLYFWRIPELQKAVRNLLCFDCSNLPKVTPASSSETVL